MLAGIHGFPGARDPARHRAQDQGRSREAVTGAGQAGSGGSDLPGPRPIRTPVRRSSRAWANCTWRSWSIASSGNSRSRPGVGKPQVAYRETIRRPAEAEGRYVRQTGGRGQYGHVKIEMEPSGVRRSGFEFENARSSADVIPREFISSIKSGIEEALEMGVLAGYPMRDVKVELLDGHRTTRWTPPRWHSRSRDRWRSRMPRAGRTGTARADHEGSRSSFPGEYMGDVIADLNSRRGRIQ